MSQEENIKVLQHLCIFFNERLVSKHTVDNVFEYRIGGVQNCKKVFFVIMIIIHYILKNLFFCEKKYIKIWFDLIC